MRLLVTGASGLVGGAVARAASKSGHSVTGLVGQFAGDVPGLDRRLAFDLRDHRRLTEAVATVQPDAIVNAAAISEPAACIADPALSSAVNVELPAQLARIAAREGIRLIHLSSEQVFAGDRAPYSPADPVSPLSLYGRQKADSETSVATLAGSRAVIVRAPLLLGNSPRETRSVHERLLLDWAAGRVPRLYTDEIRQVAHADNLADALVELCGRSEISGLHHWAGSQPCSRFDLGVGIRRHFALDPGRASLAAVERREDPAASSRPADLRLRTESLTRILRTPAESLDIQLSGLQVPSHLRSWLHSS